MTPTQNGHSQLDLLSDLPNSPKAERNLIASMMLCPEVMSEILVRSSDLFFDENRKLYSAMRTLSEGGKPVADITLLVDELERRGELESIGGVAYLKELLQAVPTAAHAHFYANVVLEKSQRRQVILSAADTLKQASTGIPTDELLEFHVETAKALEETAGQSAGKLLERYDAAEFAVGDFDLNFLIDDVLVENQPMVLGAPHKSMKTTILIDMAISLASAGHFLGRFNVPEVVRTGFISGESGKAVMQETAHRVSKAARIQLADLSDNLIFSTTLPRLDSPKGLSALRQFIVNDSLGAVLLDPAYLMLGGVAENAGNIFAMGNILLDVAQMVQEVGCTIVVAHHTTKRRHGPEHEPIGLEELAFSGWSEFSRQWLLLNRRKPYEDGTGCHELWMTIGGSAGHSGLYGVDIDEGTNTAIEGRSWDVSVCYGSEVRQADYEKAERDRRDHELEEDNADKKLIVSALTRTYPLGETRSTIKAITSFGDKKLIRLIDALTCEKVIEKADVEKPNRNKPYSGYRLTEDPNHAG